MSVKELFDLIGYQNREVTVASIGELDNMHQNGADSEQTQETRLGGKRIGQARHKIIQKEQILEPKNSIMYQIKLIRILLESKKNIFQVKSEEKVSFGYQKVKRVIRERCLNFQLIQESKSRLFKDEDSVIDQEESLNMTQLSKVKRYNFVETDDESYLTSSIVNSPICSTFYQKSSLLSLLKPIETIFN